MIYSQCRDVVFRAVEGAWDMQRCDNCGSGFLNPRPTPDSIGRAYENYFTHQERAENKTKNISFKSKISNLIRSSYIGKHYGPRHASLGPLGVLAMHMFPDLREAIDLHFRCLPFPRGTSANLLDIGCGNGAFLKIAGEAGWTTFGCDPDPAALKLAAAHTPNLRQGGVPVWSDKQAYFHAISMNHVIEHLHDPVGMLDVCRSMLVPGGLLHIETPNFDSHGRELYGESWRGLEVPRHLVIFTWRSLRDALERRGFRVEKRVFRKIFLNQSRLSAKIEAGMTDLEMPIAASELRLPTDRQVHDALRNRDRSEWITLVARKV